MFFWVALKTTLLCLSSKTFNPRFSELNSHWSSQLSNIRISVVKSSQKLGKWDLVSKCFHQTPQFPPNTTFPTKRHVSQITTLSWCLAPWRQPFLLTLYKCCLLYRCICYASYSIVGISTGHRVIELSFRNRNHRLFSNTVHFFYRFCSE